MTEKRFKIFEHSGDDYLLDMEYALGYDDPNVDYIEFLGQAMTTKECCKELNHLHEEKEQLKSFIKKLTNRNGEILLMNGRRYTKSYVEKLLNEKEVEE